MHQFKFKFDKVLEIKNIELRQQRKELSHATKEKVEADQVLQQKKANTDRFARELEYGNKKTVASLQLNYDYFYSLLDDLEKQQHQFIELEQKENSEREKLLQVHKEQKILENLREKELTRHINENQKRHQLMLDELAILGSRKTVG